VSSIVVQLGMTVPGTDFFVICCVLRRSPSQEISFSENQGHANASTGHAVAQITENRGPDRHIHALCLHGYWLL